MAPQSSDRESYFPAIEKKYGNPMSYWFATMKDLGDLKYPEQIAYLKEEHGFSQAHANALVMYLRGSKSSKRFSTVPEFYKTLDAKQVKTCKAIFKTIMGKYPDLELVIAWNQPMLRRDKAYIFGISATKNYLLMAPWSKDVLEKFAPKMADLDVNKKTIGIPSDWKVDEKLLLGMVKARLAEL
jgi:uncharacterized protein YdhG (YjbR/CyaY superfamily)